MQLTSEDKTAISEYMTEKCVKAYLTPEQTAQVIDFRLDPWWCNADSQADIIIDFFKRQNEQVDNQLWHGCYVFDPDCGPLCAEHADPRDTSIDYVRLGMEVPS